jgi:lipopolysaccharide export system ATP-binding protein
MSANLLTLQSHGLHKSYGTKTVVDNVSIHLQQQEIVGLLGPNGAGKTTSFYMMAGLVLPTQGSVFLDNTNITKEPFYQRAKRGISYLPQTTSLFMDLTVEENLRLPLEFITKNPDPKIQAVLEQFEITRLRNSQARLLSGGEKRRLEIARCLLTDPKFILLDEPFAGIDPISVGHIQEILLDVVKRNQVGILITDHNVRETLQTCNRAYILYQGSILVHGTQQDILADQTVRRIYLGENFQV